MSQATSIVIEGGSAGDSGSGRETSNNMVVRCRSFVERISSWGHKENYWLVFGLWFITFSVDPLFYYGFWINDKTKELKYNEALQAPVAVYMFFSGFIGVTFRSFITRSRSRVGEMVIYIVSYSFPVFLMLQSFLPDVAIRAFEPLLLLALMTTQLTLYPWRIFELYRAIDTSHILAESIKIKIASNLILYLYFGHVVGSLWYFFAVAKEMECWNIVCIRHGPCTTQERSGVSYKLIDNSENNYFLNKYCSPRTRDKSTYNFGIFEDAIESRMVEVQNIGRKFLYCFRWGLQNLSGFGQNLDVSKSAWENIFVIFITIYSLVMFVYFIGNMQTYLKYATKRSKAKKQKVEENKRKEDKIRRKLQEVEQWFHFSKLSTELQNSIKNHQQREWQQDGSVDLENWLATLPIDLQKNIKRELCLELLKKTQKLQRWSEQSLGDLCDCIKPVVYAQRTGIVNEGDTFIEMHLVMQGNLWTYSCQGMTASSSNNVPQENNKEHLTSGDFWGEELVSWAENELSSSNMPRSNRTILARTQVEAFVLMAVDLKDVMHKRRSSAQVIQSYFRRRKMRAFRRNAQTFT